MQRMRMVCALAGLAGVVATSAAMGQMQMGSAPAGPTGPAAEVQRGYAGLKTNILKAADKMPAEDYQYKATPEVRTYARVVNHISEAQLHSCGAVNHTAASDLAKVPGETADKAAVVEALKASFAECDKAFASLTDANLTEMFSVGPAKRSRVGLMWGVVSHDNEQYATLALYLRLKGLVPPSSEK
jgi:uncharacterized damage-inducible protein DinB